MNETTPEPDPRRREKRRGLPMRIVDYDPTPAPSALEAAVATAAAEAFRRGEPVDHAAIKTRAPIDPSFWHAADDGAEALASTSRRHRRSRTTATANTTGITAGGGRGTCGQPAGGLLLAEAASAAEGDRVLSVIIGELAADQVEPVVRLARAAWAMPHRHGTGTVSTRAHHDRLILYIQPPKADAAINELTALAHALNPAWNLCPSAY